MKPKRIQRRRTKGWRMPGNTVYIGRGSKWGNIFIANEFREAVQAKRMFKLLLEGYYDDMTPHKAVKDRILADLHELKGKDVACWCKEDAPCHGDILLELANKE